MRTRPATGMKYDGKQAFGLAISMEKGGNIITLGEKVDQELQQLKESRIPVGVDFQKVFFQPDRVRDAINVFMVNLLESVVIVILVLMLTMGFRSGVIIGTGLVIIVLGSFVVLYLFDGTLQRVSLGSLIVAMGMLVDNAIVIVDGILVDLERGVKRPAALTNIAKKTAMPLLGATLIAILAFSRSLFPGYDGRVRAGFVYCAGGIPVVELGVGVDAYPDSCGSLIESETEKVE